MKRLLKTLVVLVVLSIFGVLSVAGVVFYISNDLPQINSLKDYNPPMNSKILSRDGEVLLDIGTETRDVVAFEEIPPKVVEAFLAAEDDNFYRHEGIDYYGILRAFLVNMKEGKLVQGGSTITQQVAKSFLLTKERTISRKIKDLLLARKIEQKFSKEEILFLYLNQVYLGGGYYGVKAAFRGYFDKSLEEATPAESALVAGLLVAPGKYSPYVNPRFAKYRQSYVLKRMFETNKISKEEYEAALQEDVRMRIRKGNQVKAGHFTDWVRQEVMRTVGTEEFLTNGFTVKTTLDWPLQLEAEKAVEARVKDLDKRQGFKGALKRLETPEAVISFVLDQRKKIRKEHSTFFNFTVEGKNIYEFQETEEQIKAVEESFKDDKSGINERFRNLVDLGNRPGDEFVKFLEVGASYPGIVISVSDLQRTILVNVGGAKVIIPERGFDWAHERKFSDSPIWHAPQKTPSRIVKVGDVVLVSIQEPNVSADQLISDTFFKKYPDSALRSLIAQQKFIMANLDQEPEAEGALIALSARSGEVISLVGGTNFQKSQFNRAIQSSRQPGSAFKPFIYAAALENGYTPSSILMDTPQALGGADSSLNWKPRNYDGDFKGPMTLRSSLEVSRNIPTIKLVQDLGVSKINAFAERLHINAELPRDMSLSLGSFGISLAELVKAYAIFPNGGRAIRMKHITAIVDRNGTSYEVPSADPDWPVSASPPAPESSVTEGEQLAPGNPFKVGITSTQVYDPRLAYLMTNILRGVTLFGTATAAGKLSPNFGGKTGTTNNYVDALYVGFSNNLVVGTWAGFDDNRTLGYGETGGRTALPIWVDYMTSAIQKFGAPDFEIPEGITSIYIDKATGKPLPPGSTSGFLESYVIGYDPYSDKPMTDANTQEKPGMDDEDYFMNQ